MLSKHGVSPQEATSQPPCKKQRALVGEVDRAQQYLSPTQPGRVQLLEIGFHPGNRGGQGILPLHTHTIAVDICTNGTSSRRYGAVLLVQVRDELLPQWLLANTRKRKCNFLLARVDTKLMWLATIKNTHFVGAQKLIAEGGRTYKNLKDGMPFKMKAGDT